MVTTMSCSHLAIEGRLQFVGPLPARQRSITTVLRCVRSDLNPTSMGIGDRPLLGRLAHSENRLWVATCETPISCEARHSDSLVRLEFHEEERRPTKMPDSIRKDFPLEAVDDLHFLDR
jgi:hypothetical protein